MRHVLLLPVVLTLSILGCEGGSGDLLGPTTGSIRVVTTTAGSSPDPDGYTFAIDAQAPQLIGASASVTVAGLPAGTHSVLLGGTAANCTLSGANPGPVSVVAGNTAEVTFALNCAGPSLRWTPMASNTDFALGGVWGGSGSDVFAVGNSSIFHYDGHEWSIQSNHDGVTLRGIWGSSSSDLFAVGLSETADPAGINGVILHYDGAAWSAMRPPIVGSENGITEVYYTAVWGSTPNDVFAVGATYYDYSQALVAHYDGSNWSRMRLPRQDDLYLTDAFGTSASDVWVVGTYSGPTSVKRSSAALVDPLEGYAFMFHYNGSVWTEVDMPPGYALRGLWASSPTDAFAVGQLEGSGAVLHFDGSTWSPMTVPPTGALNEVWGTSASDVYAVGEGGILHYDGQAWSSVLVSQSLMDVWGASPTDVFTVGGSGRILHGTP